MHLFPHTPSLFNPLISPLDDIQRCWQSCLRRWTVLWSICYKKPILPLQLRVVWSWWRRYPWFSRRLIDRFTLFVWPTQWPKCYNVYPWWSSHYCITTGPCKWWCFWKRRFFIILVTSCFLLAHLDLWIEELDKPLLLMIWVKKWKNTIHFYYLLITVHWLLFTGTIHYAFYVYLSGDVPYVKLRIL